MADSVKNLGKGALRTAKNYTKGYSDAQVKVREATSNDAWGPSGTQMNEIARMTYDQTDFVEIMEMLDKRLNDKGKNWRHVFKALTVLDYCLHGGSENVIVYFKENLYIVKTLKEFQYIDENGKDQGANVRAKAKDITNLLMDDTRLREERRSRAHMANRMNSGDRPPSPRPVEREQRRPQRNRDDDDMARAIAASKRSAADEAARNQADKDLEEALRLSKEEEEAERRKREAGDRSLFDDAFNTNNNNNDQLIDLNGPSEGSNLPLQYANYNAYPQPSAAFDQAYQQYLLQQQQQQQYEAQQQQALFEQQQQQLAMQQQQELLRQQELARMQAMMQMQQQQPLVPQATSIGSNNPFARFASPAPMPAVSATPPPPSTSNSADLFGSNFEPVSQTPPPAAPPSKNPFPVRAKTNDDRHSELNRLLATGTGIDTFGNEGNTRMPAIHNRTQLVSQPTGAFPSNSNPFGPQRTGSAFQPQSQFGQQNGFAGQSAGGGVGSQRVGDTTNSQTPFFSI